MIKHLKKPILMIAAVIICLAMLRLGFWQLDRAEQKREIVVQSIQQSEIPAVEVESLLEDFESNSNELRYRQVFANGRYLDDKSILIDNQVFNSRVGYSLLTPFEVENSKMIIMVDRGWLPIGDSREILPEFTSPLGEQTVQGRLNSLPAKPPIWSDEFPVSAGQVWQFLTTNEFRLQTGLEVIPLMLELAPAVDVDRNAQSQSPVIHWQSIDNEWVYKHQAYALQWFCMSAVFLLACVIVFLGSLRKTEKN